MSVLMCLSLEREPKAVAMECVTAGVGFLEVCQILQLTRNIKIFSEIPSERVQAAPNYLLVYFETL